jgi:3-dehydroquinate synthase II
VVVAPSAPDEAGRRAVIERARSLGFRAFVARRPPTRDRGPEESWFSFDRTGFHPSPACRAEPDVPLLAVADPASLGVALVRGAAAGAVAIDWTGDRMIPLETAIQRGRRRFAVWVVTERVEEVPGALGALEHGADRVVVRLGSPAAVDALARTLDDPSGRPIAWGRAVVRAVRPVGVFERVIVDTVGLLAPEEGLLLGSSAGLLLHVVSEAEGSKFTRPRPFRVNAGSPHSYVLMADGTTRYLSELEAGDAVLVTSPRTPSRLVRVGRLKIERRPMVLVEVRGPGRTATIFLQEAETVRLSTPRGRVAVTDLGPGRAVVAVVLPKGRHLGAEVDESVEER